MPRPFLRYPGGKSKFKTDIVHRLRSRHEAREYREPFVGGGSIGLEMITRRGDRFWINDKDIGIYAMWESVRRFPEEFCAMVADFVPSVAAFDEFKAEFLAGPSINSEEDIVKLGFRKLAVHQLSFSGLGVKSGSALGGRNQESKYKIDCRWSADHIITQVLLWHERFRNRVVVTNVDYSELIENVERDALLYLDPPYYDQGAALYHHAFDDAEHQRMANLLQATKHEWLLSYDDCPRIRELYSWADIIELHGTYSISTARKKQELLIGRNLKTSDDNSVDLLIQFG